MLGALQEDASGIHEERIRVIPRIRNDRLVPQTPVASPIIALFLFQMAMMRSTINSEEKENVVYENMKLNVIKTWQFGGVETLRATKLMTTAMSVAIRVIE